MAINLGSQGKALFYLARGTHNGLRLAIDELETPLDVAHRPLLLQNFPLWCDDVLDNGPLPAHRRRNVDDERRQGALQRHGREDQSVE